MANDLNNTCLKAVKTPQFIAQTIIFCGEGHYQIQRDYGLV